MFKESPNNLGQKIQRELSSGIDNLAHDLLKGKMVEAEIIPLSKENYGDALSKITEKLTKKISYKLNEDEVWCDSLKRIVKIKSEGDGVEWNKRVEEAEDLLLEIVYNALKDESSEGDNFFQLLGDQAREFKNEGLDISDQKINNLKTRFQSEAA